MSFRMTKSTVRTASCKSRILASGKRYRIEFASSPQATHSRFLPARSLSPSTCSLCPRIYRAATLSSLPVQTERELGASSRVAFPVTSRISTRELLAAWRLTRPNCLPACLPTYLPTYQPTDRPTYPPNDQRARDISRRDECTRQASAKRYLWVRLYASSWYQDALGDTPRWYLQFSGGNVLRSSAEKMGWVVSDVISRAKRHRTSWN